MVRDNSIAFHVLLYEGRGSTVLPAETRFRVLAELLDRGYSVSRITAPPEEAAPLRSSPDSSLRELLVLGHFDGRLPELEDAAGQVALATIDLSGLDQAGILDAVEARRHGKRMNRPPGAPAPATDESGAPPRSWKPWFPVIDYDRCTNCMQCLSFCLFDVYGLDAEDRIQVQNNDNCKTNCPACSRVCPEVAIMFPKYKSGPINGEEVNPDDVNREKMKVDISSLLGGDIYSTLKNRSAAAKSRFSKERSPDKALSEREKCLVKLQKDGFIPAEVLAELDLASLPSPDEIMRKAQETAARAESARKATSS